MLRGRRPGSGRGACGRHRRGGRTTVGCRESARGCLHRAARWPLPSVRRSGTPTVAGKLTRIEGQGLKRLDSGKTDSAIRVVPLPAFAVAALEDRRGRDFLGEQPMIFPSTAGTWRDPDNFNKQWRKVRDDLGVPDVTSHSFRKSVATLIDDAGLSARVGADQLGHSKVGMTQDVYMRRGKVHTEVADLLDRAIPDE
ncbi:tyrosine-type recombinase/integrase [Mycobacterium hackensackense]|nr:tyrosine-type recombinase/integrase [Mycobacterium hackensackense]